MKIIKFLVSIRVCGAIEHFIFVEYVFTMFPTAVSYVDPTLEMHIFIHSMESIRIIISKEICIIRRGGQITNRIFIGNRDGGWGNISGISGYFILARSIINGGVRYMKRCANKISCKVIIEALINLPVVVL